jgi:hypothetical protein
LVFHLAGLRVAKTRNITAEHAETAEFFLHKGHRPNSYFEYFIISSPAAFSAAHRLFFMGVKSGKNFSAAPQEGLDSRFNFY